MGEPFDPVDGLEHFEPKPGDEMCDLLGDQPGRYGRAYDAAFPGMVCIPTQGFWEMRYDLAAAEASNG
jgi:hypothetical protein